MTAIELLERARAALEEAETLLGYGETYHARAAGKLLTCAEMSIAAGDKLVGQRAVVELREADRPVKQ